MANCILEGQEYRRSEVDEKLAGKANSSHTHTAATTTVNGFMSSTDKTKLNGIATGATANSASSTTPKVAGTAAVGTETTYARGDHVHPLQTSVSGNAGTATKLATGRTIRTNLASTATATFDGTASITPGVTGVLPIANGGTGCSTEYDFALKIKALNDSGFNWGDENEVGDASWWSRLKTWMTYATTAQRAACVGKKKKVSLSSAILGANSVSMTCIGADQDGTNTLTFQATNCLPSTTTFGTSNPLWNNSTVQTLCNSFGDTCSATASIKSITKLTCSLNNNLITNTPDVETTAKCWLPSMVEMGFTFSGNTTGAPSSITEWTKDIASPKAYSYYINNSRRIKFYGNASGDTTGTATMWYWTRSRRCSTSHSTNACVVNGDGSANSSIYARSGGLAPAFVIG